MTNKEIINNLNHKNKDFDEAEVLRLMDLARKYGQKDIRYKAIEILQKNIKNDTGYKYYYSEECIKQIQNINV
jgi:hypothetical protein